MTPTKVLPLLGRGMTAGHCPQGLLQSSLPRLLAFGRGRILGRLFIASGLSQELENVKMLSFTFHIFGKRPIHVGLANIDLVHVQSRQRPQACSRSCRDSPAPRGPRRSGKSPEAERCMGCSGHSLLWCATPSASVGQRNVATGAPGSRLEPFWVRVLAMGASFVPKQLTERISSLSFRVLFSL